MKKKLTVKEILESKGKKKLTQVYVHTPLEANACEKSEIDMIISSENNNFKFLRDNAKNTFFTVGLQYGRYLSEYEIIKKSFQLLELGADIVDLCRLLIQSFFFAFNLALKRFLEYWVLPYFNFTVCATQGCLLQGL